MRTILYLQYFEPASFPPLERSAWQFLDRGWRVHFLGVESGGLKTGFELRQHPNLTYEFVSHNIGGKYGALRYYLRAIQSIADLKPDVVYCSQERVYPVGLLATYFPNMATVLHEHDTPWADANVAPKILKNVRKRFAQRASVCVVPQAQRAKSFQESMGGDPVLVAYNCPSLKEVGPPPQLRKRPGLVLWHHGSIGPGRLPMALIDALALVPDDVHLRFAGYETVGTRGYVEKMKSRATELGISDRIVYLGAIAERDELYAAAADADVGVSLFVTKFSEPMVGASNKPFDFLSCGLPLLINDTPEWRDFFWTEGVAQICNPETPSDIARAICWYRDHPAERWQMAERGYNLIKERWNYEHSFAPILEAIGASEILPSRKAPFETDR